MTEDRVPTHILRCTMHDECDLDLRALVAEQPAPPLDVERAALDVVQAWNGYRDDPRSLTPVSVAIERLRSALGSAPSRSEPEEVNDD